MVDVNHAEPSSLPLTSDAMLGMLTATMARANYVLHACAYVKYVTSSVPAAPAASDVKSYWVWHWQVAAHYWALT